MQRFSLILCAVTISKREISAVFLIALGTGATRASLSRADKVQGERFISVRLMGQLQRDVPLNMYYRTRKGSARTNRGVVWSNYMQRSYDSLNFVFALPIGGVGISRNHSSGRDNFSGILSHAFAFMLLCTIQGNLLQALPEIGNVGGLQSKYIVTECTVRSNREGLKFRVGKYLKNNPRDAIQWTFHVIDEMVRQYKRVMATFAKANWQVSGDFIH